MSGHFGMEKNRICASFYWPSIKHDVAVYIAACDICQHRKRKTKFDRVPIVAIVRPDLPFDVIHVDVFGETTPSSSKGHKYVLVCIDACSRFAECFPLKSLTAEETCRAF